MLNLGKVKPGSTIYIPFDSFAGATGASITLTGLLASDIEIYKDGSMTQRGSDNGYTLLDTDGIDLDGITGIHGLSISLADNTTAGFYAAGSRYWVVISSVTIDTQTVNFIAATFEIEVEGAVLSTTIATLASQTSFTLTNGPAEDDALNGCVCYIHDVASAVQGGFAVVLDYTGSTKTVTLTAGTTFTAAASDNIGIFPPSNARWIASTAQTARDIGASVLISSGTGAGQLNVTSGVVDANAVAISGDTGSADNLEAYTDGTTPMPVNAIQVSGDAGAADTLEAWLDTNISGTADSGSTTTMVDAARTEADTDYWKDSEILFTSGTIAGQQRLIIGFDPATDTITFHPATTQAVGTNTYIIIGSARKDVGMLNGSRTDQNAATLSLLAVSVVNSAGSAVTVSSTGSNGDGITASGNGSGHGVRTTGGATGRGITAIGGATSGAGVLFSGGATGGVGFATLGTGANHSISVTGGSGATGNGIAITAASTNGSGVSMTGTGTGSGLIATSGGGATGNGITATSVATNGNGLQGIGNGSGVDLAADNLPGSAAVIADAVWDEVLAGHVGAGSAGEALAAAGTAGDPWTTALPGAYGAGTAGKIIGDNINATVSSRASSSVLGTPAGASIAADIAAVKTETAAILVDTGTTLDGKIDTIDTVVDAILVDTGTTLDGRIPAALVSGRMDASVGAMAANVMTAAAAAADLTTELQTGLATAASIAALNNVSAAQVNAEVVDALATDTYAEPGQGAPAATTSLAAKVNYLFKAWRNKKTQTSTEEALYGDDASTIDQKRTVSDAAGTLTKGEMATGA